MPVCQHSITLRDEIHRHSKASKQDRKGEERKLQTVGDEAAKVPADDTVPRRALAVVKRLLDVLCDVLLDVELEHRLLRCSGCQLGGGPGVRGWHDNGMTLWPGLGGRTDLDGFLLHLVAHVGRLDLGYAAGRLVLARLEGTFLPPIGAARERVRWKGSRGTTTYHRPGPLRRLPPSHSGRASWAIRRGETLGSRLVVVVRVVVRSREDVGGCVDEWIRQRGSS